MVAHVICRRVRTIPIPLPFHLRIGLKNTREAGDLHFNETCVNEEVQNTVSCEECRRLDGDDPTKQQRHIQQHTPSVRADTHEIDMKCLDIVVI